MSENNGVDSSGLSRRQLLQAAGVVGAAGVAAGMTVGAGAAQAAPHAKRGRCVTHHQHSDGVPLREQRCVGGARKGEADS